MSPRGPWIGVWVAALLVAPLRADAGCVPDFSNVSIPMAIDVMGVNGAGVPDPRAAFDIFVRDLANNPVAGAVVMVDFFNCTDMRLSPQSSGVVNPALEGQELDCSLRGIRGVTDATGRVRLSALGAGMNVAGDPAPGPGSACARVFIDGQLIRSTTVRIYDQNGAAGGADGVDISDLSRWLVDFGSGVHFARSDYGASTPGVPSIEDLAEWLRRFGAGSSSSGTLGVGFCP